LYWNNQFIIMGGDNYNNTGGIDYVEIAYNDIWSFSTTSQTWTWMGNLSHPLMSATAVNKNGSVFFLFGGATAAYSNNNFAAINELVLYDASTNTFTTLTPATSAAPSPRLWTPTTYSPVTQTVYIFGGFDPAIQQDRQDMWKFDLTTSTWTELTSSTLKPNNRSGTFAVYNILTNSILLFGGENGTGLTYGTNDFWQYSEKTNQWTQLTETNAPPARIGQAVFFKIIPTNNSPICDFWWYY